MSDAPAEPVSPAPAAPVPDEPTLRSKKFVAAMVFNAVCLVYVLATLAWSWAAAKQNVVTSAAWGIVTLTILVQGFMNALYIGGQASLDQYTRLAQIAVNGKTTLKHGSMTVGESEDPPAP